MDLGQSHDDDCETCKRTIYIQHDCRAYLYQSELFSLELVPTTSIVDYETFSSSRLIKALIKFVFILK